MGRVLFYGAGAAIAAIAAYYYSRDATVPEALYPVLLLLFGVSFLGYGIKAREDGDIGAGSGRIRRDRSPRAFCAALWLNHLLTAALFAWSGYLLLA